MLTAVPPYTRGICVLLATELALDTLIQSFLVPNNASDAVEYFSSSAINFLNGGK